jgi:hypothetical protein
MVDIAILGCGMPRPPAVAREWPCCICQEALTRVERVSNEIVQTWSEAEGKIKARVMGLAIDEYDS